MVKDNSAQNGYVQSYTLNGKALSEPFLPLADVLKGGNLVLEMGPAPNKTWGVGAYPLALH